MVHALTMSASMHSITDGQTDHSTMPIADGTVTPA